MARMLLLFALVFAVCSAMPATRKLRGMWVDVFHEGIKTPIQVTQLIERAKRAGVNALFIQVRSRAQVYHNSIYEYRAPDTTALFDGLQEVILQAHTQTPPIQVHCWINAHPLWASSSDPPWPDHVVLRHPDWLTKNPLGSTSTDVGRALDFGNPEAADYLLRLYLEVVRRYKVDGIHMDFIRYTGSEWGYNETSVARFYRSLTPAQRAEVDLRTEAALKAKKDQDTLLAKEAAGEIAPLDPKPKPLLAAEGVPAIDDPLFCQWRRKQVTAFVTKLSATAKSLRPDIIVSAAVISWGDAPKDFSQSAAYSRCFQDWKSWVDTGLLDLAIPMTYFREGEHGQWFRNWVDYCAAIKGKTPVAAGIGNWLNSLDDTLKQARLADDKLAGFCFFSYASTNPMPGQEAELFNEKFYDRMSELPRAEPPVPNVVGTFANPITFGFQVPLDLSEPTFKMGTPTHQQEVLSRDDCARLGILALQVNRYPSAFERRLIGETGNEVSLGDQVVSAFSGSQATLTDVAGRHSFEAVFEGKPDVPFLPGDLVTLIGKKEGGVFRVQRWRWLGVSRL